MKAPRLPSRAGTSTAAAASSGSPRGFAQRSAGDPIRIVASDDHAFARRLLGSASDEPVPEAALRRLAEALAVSLPVLPCSPAGELHAGRGAVARDAGSARPERPESASAIRSPQGSALRESALRGSAARGSALAGKAVIGSVALMLVGLGLVGALASRWPARSESGRAAADDGRSEALTLPSLAPSRPETPPRSTAASPDGADSASATASTASTAPASPALERRPLAVSQPATTQPASQPLTEPARARRAAPRQSDAARLAGEPTRPARAAAQREAPAPDEASGLSLELRALELAQRALRRGRLDEAERALASHARRFPSPTLAIEAELLQIDVLLARGNRSAAVHRARALVARPNARRYRERLSALVDEATGL